MAKKSIFTVQGRATLMGSRPAIQKRRIHRLLKERPANVWLPSGEKLNIPESKIYLALEDLHVDFEAQVNLFGAKTLGSADCDFVLRSRSLVIEFNGPFHLGNKGKIRDFWREVARKQAGFHVAYLEDKDLKNLHRRLVQIIGYPSIASMMTRKT